MRNLFELESSIPLTGYVCCVRIRRRACCYDICDMEDGSLRFGEKLAFISRLVEFFKNSNGIFKTPSFSN